MLGLKGSRELKTRTSDIPTILYLILASDSHAPRALNNAVGIAEATADSAVHMKRAADHLHRLKLSLCGKNVEWISTQAR